MNIFRNKKIIIEIINDVINTQGPWSKIEK